MRKSPRVLRHLFPSRRIARPRASVAALALAATLAGSGCDSTHAVAPDGGSPPAAADPTTPGGALPGGLPGGPAFAVAFAGGIPIGTTTQPTSEFGDRYNGSQRNILPTSLLNELAAIKARGGKVVLVFAGNEQYFKDADGHFSLSLWQARVDRFKGIDFGPYVDDGTVIGHYLIDEPNDPTNWNGQPVPGATLEQMAQYSKSLWPNLPTIVRVEPGYLAQWGVTYRYLDAAWAQYVYRKGDVNDFLRRNVADAQGQRLGLVVGLNLLDGGNPNGTPMTASQVETWGSALLTSPYPCAFLSWRYDAAYLADTAMQRVMDVLRAQAQNRDAKDCRNSAPPPPPPPPDLAATTTTITAHAPDPSEPGQAVTVDVTVTSAGGTPAGEVAVSASGGSESCTATLDNGGGSCALTLTVAGDRTITAEYGGSATFAASSDSASHTVRAAAQAVAITWPTPADITYGTPLGPTQLNATATSGGQAVPGTFSYQPAAAAVLSAGASQQLAVTFTPTDPAAYQGATAAVQINVLQATPTLDWTPPVSIAAGAPLGSAELNATARGVGGASLAGGSYLYTPGAGTTLDASPARTLAVEYTPADPNYARATKSVTIAVLYGFSGFFQPVDNPRILNTVKAGSAIPVRFGLGGSRPLPIFAAGSPSSAAVSCPGWPKDAIETTVSATASGLAYDAATGQYVYTWKTDRAWAGKCRRLTLTLKDGTRHEAYFRLTR